MNRLWAAVVVMFATMGVSAVQAEPSASGIRRESHQYVGNGVLIGGHGNLAGQENHLVLPEESEPVVIDPQPGDRFVRLEFRDETGRTPAVLIRQAGRGHHSDDLEFCAGAQVLELRSTEPMEIRVFTGVCHNHRYGVATTGEITATFTR